MMRRAILAGLSLFALLSLSQPSHAALNLCNRTSYILYAATVSAGNGMRQVQGWTRLAPGDCAPAIKTALTGRQLWVYARSALAHSGPQRAWGGNYPACAQDGNFNIKQSLGATCSGDFFSLPFAAVATNGTADWTMNFDEQPAFPSLTAAQLAGVRRLLKDNGLATGPLTGPPDKITGKSLAAFRARMHFKPGDGNDVLFAALEREAMKKTAPAGYTVCNDTNEDVLAAMGQGTGSHGWWRIAPGACARTITAPLSDAAIYLLAQKANGAALVSGADRFCVAPQAFDIKGRDNCAGRGFAEAGFAKTTTAGLNGTVAHIGPKGLMPAMTP